MHTKGPWKWDINPSSKVVRLRGGVPKHDMNVMDFVRWGFSGATPRFNIERRENLHLMCKACEISKPEPGREHHADWHQIIDHPDARLIAAAPTMYEDLKRERAIKEELIEALEYLRENCIAYSESPIDPEIQEAIEMAEAAIRKAKGGA